MRCEYCGYIGEKEDFEEGKYGFWCPIKKEKKVLARHMLS